MFRALAIATTVTILTILHSYVSAQAATCLSQLEFNWSYNSLGQSPCSVAIALGGVCDDGAFTLAPLQPGMVYVGPFPMDQNSCQCSTVYYSLLSACAFCQNQSYISWQNYAVNCTSQLYSQVFPNPIPSSIAVPHYAYLDVLTDDIFNVTAAMDAGGPESSAVPSPQATSSTTSTTSTTSTPTNSTSNPVSGTSHKLNVGAIAGGVVGGVVVVGMAGLIAFLILRKRSRAVPIPSTHNLNGYTSQPMMSDDGEIRYNSTTPEVPAISNMNLSDPGKLYDPNLKGPSTFPLAFTGYNPYSDSPQQSSPHTRGNSYSSLTALSARTQYAGVPEL